MAKIELTLEQALHLSGREDAPVGVRLVGALSAASLLIHTKGEELDAEFFDTVAHLVAHINKQCGEVNDRLNEGEG